MTPEMEKRRNEILEEVLGLPPEERSSLLDRECGGNIALRVEIERLLQVNHRMDPDFLTDAALNCLIPDLEQGQIIGRYVIQERIGVGGMSRVYRALDPDIGRSVALKVLFPFGEDGKERFLAELRILASIQHETVVPVYDCGEFKGLPYIVMAHLKGNDLAQAIEGRRCGGVAQKVEIARQTATALHHVHSAGIIHRDVKPGNIFLEPPGRVRLMDFGIARSSDSRLTQATLMVGTPAYMSPEQIKGQSATHLSDIFAYGMVLYELFTGVKAISGSTADILYRVVHEPLPLDPLWNANLPPALIRLIARATSKDPSKRPQSFAEILQELEGLLPVAEPVPAVIRRNTARKAVAALAIGVLASVLLVYVSTHGTNKPQIEPSGLSGDVIPPAQFNPQPETESQRQVSRPSSTARTAGREPGLARTADEAIPPAPSSINPATAAEPAASPAAASSTSATPDATIDHVEVSAASRSDKDSSVAASPVPISVPPPPVSPLDASSNPAVKLAESKAGDANLTDYTADRREILALLQQYASAYRNKDIAQLAALRPTMGKDERKAIEGYLEFAKTFEYYEFSEVVGPEFVEATPNRPMSAVIRCVRHVRMIPYTGLRPQPQDDRVTVHFERRNGIWKIVSVDL